MVHRGHHKVVVALTALFCALVARGIELVACPDCGKPVSPRAMMCPACGCPGDAIKEAVAAKQKESEPASRLPLVRLKTDRGHGYAVAVGEADRRFVVMDAMLLSGVSSLELMPLSTNTPVAYRQMQLAANEPLVRFETDETNLFFMARNPPGAEDAATAHWLLADGSTAPAGSNRASPATAVALVDPGTNLIAVVCRTTAATALCPPPAADGWRDVAPGALREQMGILAKAEKIPTKHPLPEDMASELKQTRWLGGFLEARARRVLLRTKEVQP